MADDPNPAGSRPFLPFAAGPKNRLRQRVRGGGPKPRESTSQHGHNLLRQIEAFQESINSYAAGRAPDLPPLPDEHQVIIEAKRLLPEQVTSLGLTPIEERADGLLVTISPDITLPTLVSKAQRYVTERTDSGNPKFGGVIAPIDNIRPANRQDKAGDQLAALIEAGRLDPDEPIWVDIELAGGPSDAGQKNRLEFNEYLANFSQELPPYDEAVVTAAGHYLVEFDYSLHRVYLPGRAVLDLLDNSQASWVLNVDLVADTASHTTALAAAAGAALPQLPILPNDAPRVVIIGSGIAAEHPLFRDAGGQTIIGRQRNFLPESIEPTDLTDDEIDLGHGTAMASLIAYGSLRAVTLNPEQAETPLFRIENAKVLLPANKLQPDGSSSAPQLYPLQFPKALMRQVIEAFHQPLPQLCKIFNLALGGSLYPLFSIANWAEELDNLAAYHDILFVIATGDLHPAEIIELMSSGEPYPDYLLQPQARLRTPGQAYHALTVGAITGPMPPTPPWQRVRLMAPPQHPAPFSRSGLLQQPGPVKPDVVEIGGNLNWTGSGLTATAETSLLVANRDYTTGQAKQPLGFQYGTGPAAARVTHLAGQIQVKYPRAGANLIRALIVNSADWPAAFAQSFIKVPGDTLSAAARHLLLRLCGYGVPQPDKALSSNAHCMVFVTEDEFSWSRQDRNSSGRYPAKVSFFSIRFEPDDLYRLPPATRVRVSVTLAYNPAVRKTQRRRYQAVDMRWQLRRQEETVEDFYTRWMAEAEADENEDNGEEKRPRLKPWPWQLKPVLNPGGRVRRGSLIRDWFDLYAHELPHTLDLVTLALVAPWRRPPEPLTQRFALVVSIETLDQSVPIYDSIRVQTNGQLL